MWLRIVRLAAALAALVSLSAFAVTPRVAWNVATYGPGTAPATMGCGGCASDQRSVAVDAQGNVFVSGFTDTVTNSDMMLVKYNGATGAVLWQKTFNAAGDQFEQAWALALDPAGNAIVSGYAYNNMTGEYDFKTIKYASADGAIAWENNFTGPAVGIDYGLALATDAAGNVYAGGMVFNGSNDDAKILKLAATDGAVIWDKTFTGAAGFNDYIYALAVDSAGNVVVTGEEQLSAIDSDWKTIKYAAADGAILWQASHAGTSPGLDIPFSLRIDAANNVFIAGHSFNGTNADGKVIKYAGTNGNILWEKTFSGGAGDDIFYSVALDAAGNAIATGFRFDATYGNEWNTVKYAAANGAVLWERTFGANGAFASDVSVTVAIDAQGHAIVGGRSVNGSDPADRDMQVLKLDGASGFVRWSYTYAGTAAAFDRVAGVATTSDGVVVAGESSDTGQPQGFRVIKLTDPVVPVVSDLSGEGRSDVVFQNSDGRIAAWLMNGTAVTATANLIGAGAGWSVTHAADLSGDAKADILLRHTDGRVYLYVMNGLTVTLGRELLGAGLGWSVSHTADLNGDGKADLLLRHTDGRAHIWLMDGPSVIGSASLLPAGSGWNAVATGDVNGDGRDDIVFMHDDGRAYLYVMNGTTVTAGVGFLSAGSGWTVSHAADLDGDGKADLVFRHTDGRAHMFLMNGTTFGAGLQILAAGTGWTVTHVGDLNGDGNGDLVFRHTDGRAHVRLMDGTAVLGAGDILAAGSASSVTQLRDFNGDGRKDLVIRNVNGSITVRLMNGLAPLGSATLIGPGGWSVAP
jgi:outer membrane protein assembly factor BamB